MVTKVFFHNDGTGALISDKADGNGDPTGAVIDTTAGDTAGDLSEDTIAFLTSPGRRNGIANTEPQVITAATIAGLTSAGALNQWRIVQGTPKTMAYSNPLHSDDMQVANVIKYTKTDYAAPVQQVIVVGEDGTGVGGLNLPAAIVQGDSFDLRITIVKRGVGHRLSNTLSIPQDHFQFGYVATAGDESLLAAAFADKLVDQLVASINANTILPITALALDNPAGVGMSLTSTEEGFVFSVSVQDQLEGADIDPTGSAVPAAPTAGSGTYLQAANVERNAMPVQRDIRRSLHMRRELLSSDQHVKYATAGKTYDTHVIEALIESKGGDVNVEKVFKPVTIYIFADSALVAGQKTELDTILAALT